MISGETGFVSMFLWIKTNYWYVGCRKAAGLPKLC